MCNECSIATENHSYTLFNPLCKWCGARLIQALGTLDITKSERAARRKAVLDDWEKFGHSRTEIRSLAMGAIALENVAVAENDPLKRRRKSSGGRKKTGA